MSDKISRASSVLEMRRRSVWEAADSGILLWRKNFLQFIPSFAVPVWIAAFILMLLPEDYRWISWIALWWLKPFFARFCLHITAKNFFGDSSSAKKGIYKTAFQSLAGDLLWRRFSPFRASTMPLRLLEKPTRKQYKERKKNLAQGGLNFSALLSVIGPATEAILLGGEVIFVRIFFDFLFSGASWNLYMSAFDTSLFVFAAYALNYILVESLYVCMGFGIYINCRTEAEGWDIELLFKKFGENRKTEAKNNSAPLMALLFCLGLALFSPSLAAQEEPVVTLPDDFLPLTEIPHENLDEILSSDEFGGTRQGWTIREKNPQEIEIPEEIDIDPWIEKLKEALAIGLRALIILAVAAFGIFLFIKYRRLKKPGKQNSLKKTSAFPNPLNSDEDPDKCFADAEKFFNLNMIREAWAACLCGTLASLKVYFNINFSNAITEYECLYLVRSRFARESSFNPTAEFESLVRHWVYLAYGGINPPHNSFEEALLFGKSLKNSASFEEAAIA